MPPRCLAVVLLAATACARPAERNERTATPTSASVPSAAPTPAPAPAPASASVSAPPPAPGAPCEDLARPGPAPPPVVVPGVETVRGVDVSSPAPWKAIRDAGFGFAFAAATYGLTRNNAFAANWAMMKRCGLLRGAYHRLVERGDGAAQARAFLAQLDGDPGELPPVVDVERPVTCEGACCGLSCAGWTRTVTGFVDAVTAQLSRRPIVYLMPAFLDDCLCSTRALAAHPLWLAGAEHPDFRDAPPRGGFGRWTFYQHATGVRIGGAAVDLDVFRGSAQDLERFAAGAAR